VTIKGTFGSHIQRDVAMRTLKKVLEAWRANVESSHKKNKLTITEA
jgi:hypothetical protein